MGNIFFNVIGVFAIRLDLILIKMTLLFDGNCSTLAILDLFYMREMYNRSITKL